MPKRIEVTMPDGSVWAVPAELVAENRARYYATRDTSASSGEAFDHAYGRELEIALRQHDDLIDWGENNMNWEDVQPNATMIVTPDSHVDYQEGWVNGEKRVTTE
jgi:hypothetical protein